MKFNLFGRQLLFNRVGQRQVISISELFNLLESTSGRGVLGVSRRYRTAFTVATAQVLYERDGYAAQVIRNIVGFAVGEGIRVDFGNDALNKMWNSWRWSTVNPSGDINELQAFAATSLIRDGDIFFEKREAIEGTGVALHPIDPLYIQGGDSYAGYSGVIMSDDLHPIAYNFQPYGSHYLGLPQRLRGRIIPADDVIHVYRMEYADQPRGLSWIRRALGALTELEDFDDILSVSSKQAVQDRGFYTITKELLEDPDITGAEADDVLVSTATAEIVKKLINTTHYRDLPEVKKLIEGITWTPQESTGITDSSMVDAQRNHFLDRVAASVGLTRHAITSTGDHSFPVSRIGYMKDTRFYQAMQGYLMAFLLETVDWWAEYHSMNMPGFSRLYDGYTLSPAPFPYIDPLKDSMALGKLVELGVVAPQQVIRDRNQDPKVVMALLEEWAKFQSGVKDKYGVMPGPTPASEEKDMGNLDMDKRLSDDRE